MENTVDLEIALPLEDVQKLADLAGGEEHIAEYLSMLIQKMHADQQQAVAGDFRLDQLVREADLLIRKHQEYQEIIINLKERLKKLTTSHAELMAIVKIIGNNSSSSVKRVD